MNVFSQPARKPQAPSTSGTTTAGFTDEGTPTLQDFLQRRDFQGAVTLLTFQQQTGDADETTLPWLGYSAFHLGDYNRADLAYAEILANAGSDSKDNSLYYLGRAICKFYMGEYETCVELAMKGPRNRLQTRILMHAYEAMEDKDKSNKYLSAMTSDPADTLSAAAIHFKRGAFTQAHESYHGLYSQHSDYDALLLYMAISSHKLDHFKNSNELLNMYLSKHPDSASALNLKACNLYKLLQKDEAESLLKQVISKSSSATIATSTTTSKSPNVSSSSSSGSTGGSSSSSSSSSAGGGSALLRHNLVVMRDGEDALTHLPPLLDVVPEARFNLAAHHLRNAASIGLHRNGAAVAAAASPPSSSTSILGGPNKTADGTINVSLNVGPMNGIEEAYRLVRDLVPKTPNDFVIKGTVNAAMSGDDSKSPYAQEAIKFLGAVGASESEKDTPMGRKCQAQVYLYMKSYKEACVYLSSIDPYCDRDGVFNFNYGIALAGENQWELAAKKFLLCKTDPSFVPDEHYYAWLIRSKIMSGEPDQAWRVYQDMDHTAPDILAIVASDCYTTGHFLHSLRAYDVLYRLDPSREHLSGKKGAACGVLQMAIAGRCDRKAVGHAVRILQMHEPAEDVMPVVNIMKKWMLENGIPLVEN